MRILLDTCAILHLAQDATRLSAAARVAVIDPGSTLYVSAALVGEIACLAERKRIQLPVHWRTWLGRATEQNGWNHLPITSAIIEEAYSLPEPIHRDPVDRVVIATARLSQLTILTTDRLILAYPHVASIS